MERFHRPADGETPEGECQTVDSLQITIGGIKIECFFQASINSKFTSVYICLLTSLNRNSLENVSNLFLQETSAKPTKRVKDKDEENIK